MKKTTFIFSLIMIWGLVMNGQAFPDRHNTSWTESWLSCTESQSQNEKRDPSHWILYDLGDQYALQQSTIWNYNVPEELERGVRDIVIDYSTDGEDWIELTEFEVPIGPGSAFYEGAEGPHFEGVLARYILISITSDHGDGTCVGMSEFKVEATVATSTDIVDGDLELDVEVSPNPATDYVEIKLTDNSEKDLIYSLMDASGRMLRQGPMNGDYQRIITSELSSGVYTLSIHNKNGIISRQLSIVNN